MIKNQAFRRKISYIAVMAGLLIPLYWLSQPETHKDPGGFLAQMRHKHNLSQAQLGDVDPAGEAMKLALLGMKGIAANILWEKANGYKKTEDYTKYSAALEQITKLQPNFIAVWQFQAWNLSYNVSVEHDNYLHRYHWVKKGINFLIDGTEYNRDSPRLLWDIGWFFGQKLGRSDEHAQFRREFRKDADFHDYLLPYVNMDNSLGPDLRPDNWLVGREWYLQAEGALNRGASLRGKSPVLFFSSAPMSQLNFASALGDDGIFGDTYTRAWENGHDQWIEYGNYPILTSFGFHIRLNDFEPLDEEVKELKKRLDEFAPGIEQQIYQEKYDALSPETRQALELEPNTRTPEDLELIYPAEIQLEVSVREMADRVPADLRDQARGIASRVDDKHEHAQAIKRYRDIVNFVYWRTRCEVEQGDEANKARQYLHDADQFYRDTKLDEARVKYEAAWDEWAKIFDKYPSLLSDVGGEDVTDAVKRYARCLEQLDAPFPADFKLKSLIEFHDSNWRPWDESAG